MLFEKIVFESEILNISFSSQVISCKTLTTLSVLLEDSDDFLKHFRERGRERKRVDRWGQLEIREHDYRVKARRR